MSELYGFKKNLEKVQVRSKAESVAKSHLVPTLIDGTPLAAPATKHEYARRTIPELANWNVVVLKCKCGNIEQNIIYFRDANTGNYLIDALTSTVTRGVYLVHWATKSIMVKWVDGSSNLAPAFVQILAVYGLVQNADVVDTDTEDEPSGDEGEDIDITGLTEEVLGIRIGADGTIYETAGEAVREQYNKLAEMLDALDVEATAQTINGLIADVNAAVDAAIAQIETAGGLVLDPTLTQSGQAADAKVTGDAITVINSGLGEFVDEFGSWYTSISEMTNALIKATNYPMYSYHFKTYKRNISGSSITDSDQTYRSTQILRKPASCLIRLTTYGKSLVDNSGYTIAFIHINGWNGETITGSYALNMDVLGWLNYNYNYSDCEYFALKVNAPSGVTNEVTDINTVVEVVTISQFYKDNTLGYIDSPQIAPYKEENGAIISDASSADRSKVWGIAINTENVKCVYSDMVAFDYALQDADGNILKSFTGNYTDCCIEIPERYNGHNVSKLKANIFMRGRNAGVNLYDYFPMYCERICMSYKVPVTHAPINSSDASIAIENAKTIISISEPINRTFKPLYGTSNPIESKVVSKIPYRYRDRHQVGYQKSFETYLSCIDACGHNNRSAATVTNGNANGDYGLMCSGFIVNVLQSALFFSTTTFKHYKGAFFEPIPDLSYAEVGDILFFDGLTGSSKGSNHVALMVDKVTIGGTLAYVVIAEASHKGVGYTTAKAPYRYNDKDIYKINLTKAGIHPVRIKENTFIPTDAVVLKNYDSSFSFKKVYSGAKPLTFRSFWGNKVNIPATSLQNIVLSSTNSVPDYPTIKVYKNESLIGTYTVTDLLTEIGTGHCQFNLSSIVDGDGYYEIKSDTDEELAEFYIYTRIVQTSGASINLEPLFEDGFYPDKTYVRYLAESGQGRSDQYIYRPLTEEEKTSKSVTFSGTEDRIFAFNKYGGIDMVIESGSDDDEGDTQIDS